ncbi:MAG: hypothetical protein ACREDO_08180 [Methyloceanibacter sp.]
MPEARQETLIGLIFVVITLGMENAQGGYRADGIVRHAYPPLLRKRAADRDGNGKSDPSVGARGVPRRHGVRGLRLCDEHCAHVEAAHRYRAGSRWNISLPLLSFVLVAVSAASWALETWFADDFAALASVVLLVTALRNSWIATLYIGSRKRDDGGPDGVTKA